MFFLESFFQLKQTKNCFVIFSLISSNKMSNGRSVQAIAFWKKIKLA